MNSSWDDDFDDLVIRNEPYPPYPNPDPVISILAAEPFTIEAWIKPTSIKTIALVDANGNPNPLAYGDIIIGDTKDNGNNWSLQLFNNKLTFYRYKNAVTGFKFFTSNSQIPLNTWTHVAVSYDGGSTLSIFINGTLDRTFVDYSPPDTEYNVITIGNLFNTGTLAGGNGACAYKGYITNLRINDNQFFYQYVGPFEPTAPLGYISGTTLLLLANTNQPIKDSSPRNITITNVGSVTSSSQYPTVTDCANNDAKVLMVGWAVGPRVLTRSNENLYTYFDETLYRTNTSSPWVYANVGIPLATSLTVSQFPWQAVWPSPYTATKVCPNLGIPVATASVVMNLTRYGSSSTTTLVKKSTQGEFLGNSSGSGDPFYLVSGFVYKKVAIFSGEDYGSIYLVPPNASVGDNPNDSGWIQPESFWRIMEFYSDDGTRSNELGKNTSTSTTTIPSTGWIPDPRYPQFESSPNGVTAITITAA